MLPAPEMPTNVVRFRGAKTLASYGRDQRTFLDAVYSVGSLPVAADDRATRAMAMRLTIFGFVVIDEIQVDGTARRLRPSEAFAATDLRPWRVSKPNRAGPIHAGLYPDQGARAASIPA